MALPGHECLSAASGKSQSDLGTAVGARVEGVPSISLNVHAQQAKTLGFGEHMSNLIRSTNGHISCVILCRSPCRSLFSFSLWWNGHGFRDVITAGQSV